MIDFTNLSGIKIIKSISAFILLKLTFSLGLGDLLNSFSLLSFTGFFELEDVTRRQSSYDRLTAVFLVHLSKVGSSPAEC